MKFLFLGIVMTLTTQTAFAACDQLHNFQFTTLQGDKFNLCDYHDKPVLVVNTASKCGFTPQFEKLEAMYSTYKSRGLLVLGFPSNDFHQELSGNKEIGDFCKNTYAVNFPMMSKSSVVGVNANPLYQQLIALTNQPPMWNFYKYLVLPNGKIYSYSSDVEPDSAQVMDKLKPFLK
ncbi:MAG TPA: glutathione peroxidase [Methylophilaceae bacterium]|jgi:glutathione peroxidase